MRTLPLLLVLAACPPPTTPTVDPGTDDTDAVETPFSDLEEGAWSYVSVDGMICGNGAATGIGVNPGSDPTRVVTLVQGGGACWDTASCYVLKSATHVESGWGEAQLTSEAAGLDGSPLFDRDDADNPWAQATWVLVPYCTGDLHAGDAEGHYDPLNPERTLHHHGNANMVAVVDRLTRELPDVEQAWFVGLSAGGYGVELQADRLVGAWPSAETALLADGSPMVHPYDGRYGVWRSAWNLRLPEGCEACETSMTAVLEARLEQVEGSRVGLITTRSDSVITLFFNYPLGQLAPAVDRLVADVYVPTDDVEAFVVDGDQHVLIGNLDREGPGGVRLGDWVEGWRDGASDWDDVR